MFIYITMEVSNSNQINEEQIADQMNDIDKDNNKINEDNLNVLNGEVDDYITDSDVDDPKYLPSTNINIPIQNNQQTFPIHQHVQTNSSACQQPHNPNIIISTTSLNNEMFGPAIHDKLRSMQTDFDTREKQFRDVVNENVLLKNEILKLQESLNARISIIDEFQSTFDKTTFKFKQLSEKITNLQKQKEILLQQVNEYENEMQKLQIRNEELESHFKSVNQFQEHVSSLQNEYSRKEMNLTLKHKEKENEIKIELNHEITKLTQQNEDLKSENEKLKFELSNKKIHIDSYVSQSEEKETNLNEELKQKNNELKKQTDLINEYEQRLLKLEKMFQEQKQTYESDVEKLTQEKEELTTDLDDKLNVNYDIQTKLNELSQQYESVTAQNKEYKYSLENKDRVINQLKNQIESMNSEMVLRDNAFDLSEKQKSKDINDYNSHIHAILNEKHALEKVNTELNDNLTMANQKIKELRDFISDKYNSIKHSIYKENNKNQHIEHKYKGIINHLKQKEKSLILENSNLKEMLNDKEAENEQIETHYQNQIRNISLNNVMNPNINKSNLNYNNNENQLYQLNNQNLLHNNSAINTRGNYNLNSSHYNGIGNFINNSYYVGTKNPPIGANMYDDPKEEVHKRNLEDFKKLLNNIDEKLDFSEPSNGHYY